MPFFWKDRYQHLTGYPDLYARIKAAERHASRMLPFIPRGLPVYQSHGMNHSLSIIRHINQILWMPGLQCCPQEVFLLYLAAWFHDIGYLHPHSLHNRKIHTILSCDMIRKDPVIAGLVDEQEMLVLDIIVRYHNSHSDPTLIPESLPFRAQLLAALFRLADLADIGADRCPPDVLDLIQDGLSTTEVQHWQAHTNIIGCVIIYPIILVLVKDLNNPFFKERLVPHIEEDLLSPGLVCERYGLAFPVPVYLMSDSYSP